MYDEQKARLADAELHAFFDCLFPHGFAGADVLADIAPEGWEQSPLLACFHPSLEQRYEEAVQLHRNLEELSRAMRRKDAPEREPRPEPTLDEIRSECRAEPVNVQEEVTELIGLCLWDVFSDNHDVTAADGRVVDIGSLVRVDSDAFEQGHIWHSAPACRSKSISLVASVLGCCGRPTRRFTAGNMIAGSESLRIRCIDDTRSGLMIKTVEAVIDEKGNVKLLEHVRLGVARRALVTILDEKPTARASETALLSEAALGEDWNRPEEDEAWSHLQRVR